MSKINETLRLLQSGARSNKYRILYPVFGKEIDIVCNASSMPGRGLNVVEVYVKGRKIKLAGEMEDEGTWDMTIYNTQEHLHRRFFLKMIGGVHNFNTPSYLLDGGSIPDPSVSAGTNTSISGSSSSGMGLGDVLSGVSDTIDSIEDAYDDVRSLFSSTKAVVSDIKNTINGDWQSAQSLIETKAYSGSPWYQLDVIIQQLDHDDNPVAECVMHNCFVTNVGNVEYTDEAGEMTTSTISFAYSGLSFGNNTEIPVIESY